MRRRERPRWRRTFSHADLDSESYLTKDVPHSARSTDSSRTRAAETTSPTSRPPPLHIGRASESPLQVQLRKHEKARRRDIQALAQQLEAVYDHLEALDHDEEERDELMVQRFQKEGEALQVALDEMAGMADRLAASEIAQQEAAHNAASSAEAVATMAAEVAALKVNAERSSAELESLAAQRGEAERAHAEIRQLRIEMGALQQRAADSEAKALRLEALLERVATELQRLALQNQELQRSRDAGRSEAVKLGGELRDVASAMEEQWSEWLASTAEAHARETCAHTAALTTLEGRVAALDDGYHSATEALTLHTERLARLERGAAGSGAEVHEVTSRLQADIRALRATVDGWGDAFAAASRYEVGCLGADRIGAPPALPVSPLVAGSGDFTVNDSVRSSAGGAEGSAALGICAASGGGQCRTPTSVPTSVSSPPRRKSLLAPCEALISGSPGAAQDYLSRHPYAEGAPAASAVAAAASASATAFTASATSPRLMACCARQLTQQKTATASFPPAEARSMPPPLSPNASVSAAHPATWSSARAAASAPSSAQTALAPSIITPSKLGYTDTYAASAASVAGISFASATSSYADTADYTTLPAWSPPTLQSGDSSSVGDTAPAATSSICQTTPGADGAFGGGQASCGSAPDCCCRQSAAVAEATEASPAMQVGEIFPAVAQTCTGQIFSTTSACSVSEQAGLD